MRASWGSSHFASGGNLSGPRVLRLRDQPGHSQREFVSSRAQAMTLRPGEGVATGGGMEEMEGQREEGARAGAQACASQAGSRA